MTQVVLASFGQIPISFVHDVIANVVRRDYDWKTLLKKCDIDPAALSAEGACVPIQSYAMLQERTMELLGDEMLGYGARVHKIGLWKNACRASLCEGSLGQVLGRILDFFELFEASPQTRLLLEGDEAVIETRARDGNTDLDIFAYEHVFSALYRFAIWLIQENIQVSGLTFQHAYRRPAAEYAWLFHTQEALFDQPRTTLRFDRKWLDMPVKRDSRNLEVWLGLGYLGLYDDEIGNLSWSTRLREILGRNLPEIPEFSDVAAELKLHPRALRRRLSAEGLSYQEIKDQVRRDAAQYYLSESALSIEEIAYRSGFSEASCLIRAFKRWTGTTPHRYSQTVRGQQPHEASGVMRSPLRLVRRG
jgi:AraC-like DNA-binding protein